jgi:pyruvate/2-oxoglutarate dehydrogenase complex dihydrolipoamide dehydrogenase (E3) component
MQKYDLVVIGAGSGGLSTAAGAARLGLKTLLVEKNQLGGDCLWHGCIPSKVLIHEAEKIKTIVGEGIQVDYAKHFKEAQKRILMVQMAISEHDSVERFNELGVDVQIGTGKFVSKSKVCVTDNFGNQKTFKFKKCVVATGSKPRIPDNFKNVQFYTNDTFFDMSKLPESMIIVGGGSIGVEMGSAMAMFGVKVKMILKEDRIMPKEEVEIGRFMMERMREELKVEFYNFADIKEVYERDVNGKKEVHVDIGNNTVLKSESILVCIGRNYNTEMDLGNAGIKFSERGIEIDKYLRTTNQNVYAIGDVNGFRLFTHAAGYYRRLAIAKVVVLASKP